MPVTVATTKQRASDVISVLASVYFLVKLGLRGFFFTNQYVIILIYFFNFPIFKFDYYSITARDHCHLNVNCWFGFSCWVKQSFLECICCLVFRNSSKKSKFTHVNWVEGNKQRSYQRWLDKRFYKTKFWAVLGSQGYRKNFPTAISLQLFGMVFSTFCGQKDIFLKKYCRVRTKKLHGIKLRKIIIKS